MQTVYRTVNLTDKKFYLGVHETSDPNDAYLGSGVALEADIEKLGRANFQKTILFSFDHRKDAYEKEMELIEVARKDPLCYNIHDGGRGGNTRAYHKVGRSGAANGMFGRRWSVEEKKAIGDRSRAAHAAMSSATKRASRKRSSDAQKGKSRPVASVEKMCAKAREEKDIRKRRFTIYQLTGPDGVSYRIEGKAALADFCLEQSLCLWSVDWVLLEGKEPKHGSCVGWQAKIVGHLFRSRQEHRNVDKSRLVVRLSDNLPNDQ